MVSSVFTHTFWMISSLKTTRFAVQFSPHKKRSAEKFDKTFADCVSFTCFIRLSVLLLTIKISQSGHENSLSYCKIAFCKHLGTKSRF